MSTCDKRQTIKNASKVIARTVQRLLEVEPDAEDLIFFYEQAKGYLGADVDRIQEYATTLANANKARIMALVLPQLMGGGAFGAPPTGPIPASYQLPFQ